MDTSDLSKIYATEDQINFEFTNVADRKIEVYDMQGRLRTYKKSDKLHEVIGMDQTGIYIVKIMQGNQILSRKIWIP